MTTYKGYTGVFSVDPDANVIRGKVVDLKDTITFQGATAAEAMKAFRDSVDDYLEFCKSLGEKPERPFSGKFLVRIKPRTHRTLTALAQSKGVSLNKLVAGQLTKMASRPAAARYMSVSSRNAAADSIVVPKAKVKAVPKAKAKAPVKRAVKK